MLTAAWTRTDWLLRWVMPTGRKSGVWCQKHTHTDTTRAQRDDAACTAAAAAAAAATVRFSSKTLDCLIDNTTVKQRYVAVFGPKPSDRLSSLALSGPQSRVGHKLLGIRVACPRNGTAVRKGL